MTQHRNSVLTGLMAKNPKKTVRPTPPSSTSEQDIDEMIGQVLGGQEDPSTKEKTMSAGYHTLTIKKEEVKGQELIIDAENVEAMKKSGALPESFEHEYISMELPPTDVDHDIYELYVGDFMTKAFGEMMTMSDITNLNLMLNAIKKGKAEDEIAISIDSNGGSIDEGLRLMYAIRRTFLPESITTILAPKGYSMGSHMFLIGQTRIIYEDSAIMLHDYSTGYGGKGTQIKDYIEHSEERLNKLTYTSYVTPGYITKEEYAEYKIGKELWFTADAMIERGMATHVILRDGTVITAEEFKELASKEDK
jgi:ATP-dependent protease ClpP protease subunit